MSSLTIEEGVIPFQIPGVDKRCETWYKIVGDLKNSKKRPLLVLHGGPGFSHYYLLSLQDLTTKYGIPVIFYDQIGGGQSTHLPEKKGDASFWTIELFMDELDNVVKHLGIGSDYDIVGHSWGGMLLAEYIINRQPKGLKHAVLASSLASMEMWIQSANQLLTKLPEDVQAVIRKHEADGTTDSPEYEEAVMEFFGRFVCTIKPFHPDFMKTLEVYAPDPTVYHTMLGVSEFNISGSLRTWSVLDTLHKINVPTLVTNGKYDEAQDFVVAPMFWKVPKAKWYTFSQSSHLSHLEERDHWINIVSQFLGQ